MAFVDGIKYLSDVDIEMKLRFSCQQLKKHLAKLAKLATAVTAVKAGDNKLINRLLMME